eukprot:CAMPEP_0114670370 /NCGR_PEP_ID=MMETSP0191-20121206/39437_1 /TAXON_ID=126664 /ORGANISM="Sorites sp." /LENGTH=328 /DNA_ID=CAMNT_0001927839 /DNA_START=293 /DNA_END=1279 /DNA_ORIENTATION=+
MKKSWAKERSSLMKPVKSWKMKSEDAPVIKSSMRSISTKKSAKKSLASTRKSGMKLRKAAKPKRSAPKSIRSVARNKTKSKGPAPLFGGPPPVPAAAPLPGGASISPPKPMGAPIPGGAPIPPPNPCHSSSVSITKKLPGASFRGAPPPENHFSSSVLIPGGAASYRGAPPPENHFSSAAAPILSVKALMFNDNNNNNSKAPLLPMMGSGPPSLPGSASIMKKKKKKKKNKTNASEDTKPIMSVERKRFDPVTGKLVTPDDPAISVKHYTLSGDSINSSNDENDDDNDVAFNMDDDDEKEEVIVDPIFEGEIELKVDNKSIKLKKQWV